MTIDINNEIEIARKSWELSKYTDEELKEELTLREKLSRIEASENLYAVKDVIDFDEDGIPFNTEAL